MKYVFVSIIIVFEVLGCSTRVDGPGNIKWKSGMGFSTTQLTPSWTFEAQVAAVLCIGADRYAVAPCELYRGTKYSKNQDMSGFEY